MTTPPTRPLRDEPPPRQSYVAWLIECHTSHGAEWLVSTIGAAQWTTDANAAVKFETAEDAHHEIRSRGGPLACGRNGGFAIPTEHVWILASPHPAPAVAVPTGGTTTRPEAAAVDRSRSYPDVAYALTPPAAAPQGIAGDVTTAGHDTFEVDFGYCSLDNELHPKTCGCVDWRRVQTRNVSAFEAAAFGAAACECQRPTKRKSGAVVCANCERPIAPLAPSSAGGPTREQIEAMIAAGRDPASQVQTYMTASGEPAPLDGERAGAFAAECRAARRLKAELLIGKLCKGDRWRMSIPVHRDDSDVLLSDVVADSRWLESRLSTTTASLTAEREARTEAERQLAQTKQTLIDVQHHAVREREVLRDGVATFLAKHPAQVGSKSGRSDYGTFVSHADLWALHVARGGAE